MKRVTEPGSRNCMRGDPAAAVATSCRPWSSILSTPVHSSVSASRTAPQARSERKWDDAFARAEAAINRCDTADAAAEATLAQAFLHASTGRAAEANGCLKGAPRSR